jgi:hypothetical protein
MINFNKIKQMPLEDSTQEYLRERVKHLNKVEKISSGFIIKKAKLTIGKSTFSLWQNRKRNLNKINTERLTEAVDGAAKS